MGSVGLGFPRELCCQGEKLIDFLALVPAGRSLVRRIKFLASAQQTGVNLPVLAPGIFPNGVPLSLAEIGGDASVLSPFTPLSTAIGGFGRYWVD